MLHLDWMHTTWLVNNAVPVPNNGARLYRGDWSHGHMHGCGTALWKQPGGKPVEGQDVTAAEGKFFGNTFVGDVMPCSKEDGFDSAVEADMAAYQARSFLQVSGVSALIQPLSW
jgi:hypothetical protein